MLAGSLEYDGLGALQFATEVTKARLRQFQSMITSSALADCSVAMAMYATTRHVPKTSLGNTSKKGPKKGTAKAPLSTQKELGLAVWLLPSARLPHRTCDRRPHARPEGWRAPLRGHLPHSPQRPPDPKSLLLERPRNRSLRHLAKFKTGI